MILKIIKSVGKKMLHIVKNKPALEQARLFFSSGDAILLIEDAVYTEIEQINTQEEKNDPKDHYFYLKEDVEARGLSDLVGFSVQLIDYNGFVSLTEKHEQSLTWE